MRSFNRFEMAVKMFDLTGWCRKMSSCAVLLRAQHISNTRKRPIFLHLGRKAAFQGVYHSSMCLTNVSGGTGKLGVASWHLVELLMHVGREIYPCYEFKGPTVWIWSGSKPSQEWWEYRPVRLDACTPQTVYIVNLVWSTYRHLCPWKAGAIAQQIIINLIQHSEAKSFVAYRTLILHKLRTTVVQVNSKTFCSALPVASDEFVTMATELLLCKTALWLIDWNDRKIQAEGYNDIKSCAC